MERFKNVLLLLQGGPNDDAAVERGARLARRNKARVTVVRALGEVPQRLHLIDGARAADIARWVSDGARREAEAVAESLRSSGVEAVAGIALGRPFVEIIRRVLQAKHDLVVMAADGGGARGKLLGSVARRLMRQCPCPVWAIKPETGTRFGKVLAAVDPDPAHPTGLALSRKVVDLASSLARRESPTSELHIVHAFELYGETLLRSHAKAAEVDDLVARTREVHQQQLQAFLADFALDDLQHQIHLLCGEPGPTIVEASSALGVDLVVMGTLGRTGVAGFFIGNAAEAVLSSAACSVLAVKPEGFVSPVAAG